MDASWEESGACWRHRLGFHPNLNRPTTVGQWSASNAQQGQHKENLKKTRLSSKWTNNCRPLADLPSQHHLRRIKAFAPQCPRPPAPDPSPSRHRRSPAAHGVVPSQSGPLRARRNTWCCSSAERASPPSRGPPAAAARCSTPPPWALRAAARTSAPLASTPLSRGTSSHRSSDPGSHPRRSRGLRVATTTPSSHLELHRCFLDR